MANTTMRPTTSKNDFSLIAESFLNEPGLPLGVNGDCPSSQPKKST